MRGETESGTDAPDRIELSGQQFQFIESRPFDNKHRINLGKKVFELLKGLGSIESFKVYASEEGFLLLTPMVHIPANEMWIWRDPEIRESFRKALGDAREGRITRVDDLDSFLGSQ
ncbi:MAG: hypothetical protein ACETWG_07765 [Candidatus Neomarinimicrobiota bacterium]